MVREKKMKEVKVVLERKMGLAATIQCCTVALGAVKIVMQLQQNVSPLSKFHETSCFNMYENHANMKF